MMIEETLFRILEEITDTFVDSVPEEFTKLPVIRYFNITSTPSMTGDDRPVHFQHSFQIDLYQEKRDKTLSDLLIEKILSLEWIVRIQSISHLKEDGVSKTTIQLIIEE